MAAWIRYSNGSGKSANDKDGDGRGMAVKLMNVAPGQSQDFLMINHPTFFVRNAEDYVDFQKAVTGGNILKFFFPGFNPLKWRIHEMAVAKAITRKKVSNPLETKYLSMTPYKMGEKQMKYFAVPCESKTSNQSRDSEDHLRENMAECRISFECASRFPDLVPALKS